MRLTTKGAVAGGLLLLLAVGAVYSNALQNGFVFDDHNLVLLDARFRSPDTFTQLFIGKVRGGLAYRPIRSLSYALDYALFGLRPAGWHAFNIFYHLLNSLLAFLVAIRLLGHLKGALFVALLFALHPVQADAVTYISGRRDLLSGLFFFIGFLAFLQYREREGKKWFALAGAAYLLALLSKEMSVTLPLVFLAYDTIRNAEKRTVWQGLRLALARGYRLYTPLITVGGLFGAYVLLFAHASRQMAYYGGSPLLTILTTARAFAHYVKLLAFPATLSADYSFNGFPATRSLADPAAFLALLVLGAILYGLVALKAELPMAAFGGLWFFIVLLPVSQLIPHHELMAEHYLYIPSFGLFLAAGAVLARHVAKGRRTGPAYAACALALLLLGARTNVRNQDWKDDLTLWTKTAQTVPQSARARANLGKAYIRRGLDGLAEQEFAEAVRIQPEEPQYRDNLGLAHLRLGRLAEAELELREALRADPSLVSGHMNLGLTLYQTRRFEEAKREFREALQIRPNVAMAWYYLGRIQMQGGRVDTAEPLFQAALRLEPHSPELLRQLAAIHLEQGRLGEAEREARKAASLAPSEPPIRLLLAKLHDKAGRGPEAIAEAEAALRLDPNLEEARVLLRKLRRFVPSQ